MGPGVVDRIIEACEVKRKESVIYCLGPFARRVSFSAQQNRALNLVRALFEAKRFSPGASTAVIGGGIAGLTAAAGLIGHGCKVDLFEASKNTLAMQRRTTHRLVHPTINSWPTSELQLTTELPFLEWSAGKCSDVTKSIADQFVEILGVNRLFRGHRVTDITDLAAGLVRLKVTPAIPGNEGYKLVIIAIGFGPEKPAPPFMPTNYWFPDNLETYRELNTFESFLVSGCGDGGLIDVLRLVHREFEMGQLAFDIAGWLSKTGIASKLADAEGEAKRENKPAGLAESYRDCADELDTNPDYKAISDRLCGSLETSDIIYLIDQELDEPYSLNAAPIHKLMIAHARKHGAIMYRKGTATLTKEKVRFAALDIAAPPKSKIVIRHGPKPEFGRLLSEAEVEDLRGRQTHLADLLADPQWTEPYPVPPPLRLRNLDDIEFIRSRAKLSRQAVRTLDEEADIMLLAGCLRAIYADSVPPNAPKSLFGIPVENEVLRTDTGIDG